MKVIPIASSSSGNAYAVACGGEVILVDCGISCKSLRESCASRGVDLGSVSAVLITHDHSDHVGGLKVFLARYDVPVYANMMTAEKLICANGIDESAFVCFENGQSFDVGGVRVTPFSTPHDAVDPVGYFMDNGRSAYFHATDVGTALDSFGAYLARADIATVESNHDPVMLKARRRPDSLKERILGPRGHLSNDQAAAFVGRYATARLKKLFLAHLSGECNAAHIAERTMREELSRAGLGSVEISVLR
jgi:phosphoribosyl 1,2-cyclic phosphodiesterase